MTDNPWGDLARPASTTAISARRVDESNRWDLYWAMDYDGHCLLVLAHSALSSPTQRLPHLREIEVEVQTSPASRPMLVLRLLKPGLRDVFFRLCSDIVGATTRCETEQEAVGAAVARTWRWHHLLRGGSTGLLSPEDQMGLIGELLVLDRYFVPILGAARAVDAWRGPLGEAKDFVSGAVSVESKARAQPRAGSVSISSEYQLAWNEPDQLFLHLCAVDPVNPGDDGAFNLTDVATRVREGLAAGGEAVIGRYEALLAAAGFQFDDDYSDSTWVGGERSIYKVVGGFPRITADSLPTAIRGVRYVLSLTDVSSFIVPPSVLQVALTGTLE